MTVGQTLLISSFHFICKVSIDRVENKKGFGPQNKWPLSALRVLWCHQMLPFMWYI